MLLILNSSRFSSYTELLHNGNYMDDHPASVNSNPFQSVGGGSGTGIPSLVAPSIPGVDFQSGFPGIGSNFIHPSYPPPGLPVSFKFWYKFANYVFIVCEKFLLSKNYLIKH